MYQPFRAWLLKTGGQGRPDRGLRPRVRAHAKSSLLAALHNAVPPFTRESLGCRTSLRASSTRTGADRVENGCTGQQSLRRKRKCPPELPLKASQFQHEIAAALHSRRSMRTPTSRARTASGLCLRHDLLNHAGIAERALGRVFELLPYWERAFYLSRKDAPPDGGNPPRAA